MIDFFASPFRRPKPTPADTNSRFRHLALWSDVEISPLDTPNKRPIPAHHDYTDYNMLFSRNLIHMALAVAGAATLVSAADAKQPAYLGPRIISHAKHAQVLAARDATDVDASALVDVTCLDAAQ